MRKSDFIMIFLLCGVIFNKTEAAKPLIKATATSESCYGKDDGSLYLEYTCNPPEVSNISITDSSDNIVLNFVASHDTTLLIKDLKPGKYTIGYNYKNKPVIVRTVIENKAQLKANIIKIKEIKGKGTDMLASLEAKPSGGTKPYLIQWSENTRNQQGEIAKDLPQGIYKCIINDVNKCGPVSATFFLYEPEIEKFMQKKNTNN